MVKLIQFCFILLLISCNHSRSVLSTDVFQVYTISRSHSNIHLLVGSDGIVMIDCGYEKDRADILDEFESLDLDVERIRYIILTHAHGDHVGNAEFFKKKSSAKVIAGKEDVTHLQQGTQDDICPTSMLAKIMKSSVKDTYDPVQVDISVDNIYQLSSWDLDVECVPGHTPGSLVVYTSQGVFVGDLIRGGIFRSKSPQRHFFMCDEDDNDADIEYVRLKSQGKMWYTGHFGPLDMEGFEGF